MTFAQKLEKAITKNNSLLCVGLDPDLSKLPKSQTIFQFNKWIIDQTAPFVCAYKPNIAFYEALGIDGLKSLKRTIDYLKKQYPHIPIILDAKRADIASTSTRYAQEAFDFLDADAITVNPYLGKDALEPFFKRRDRGIIVLCKTSNPGAKDFQDLMIKGEPLYMQVAKKIISWNKKYRNLLMVIGATYPKELKKIRDLTADMTFLIPGVGAQGGDLESTLKNGLIIPSSSSSNQGSKQGLIMSSSRGIIYDQDPRSAAQKLRDEINKYR